PTPSLAPPGGGAGYPRGAGGTERIPWLSGRGRALEIILGADDFDADTAERYGWVNRSLPDSELDGFVDTLARRLASFDRRPIEAAKNLVNRVSLPPLDRLLDGRNAFLATLAWPETQQRVAALFKRGMQQEGDLENRFGAHVADLRDDGPKAV
ncbi:enoyl-CoA hydratase/isomerase family protein, partial [Streptomyces sp. NPDC059744]|uniref:enoyl-CoA hydratase/isomerase family protein n=1 Tax=Streptomyces sp. NPDC059744 TaxID=3346929 RepID=UPI003646B744